MERLGSVARAVLTFALLGLLVLVLVGVTGVLVLRRLATQQAISQARDFTAFAASVVERRLDDGLLTGDAEASLAVATVVTAVLDDPVVRVKIWTADGQIVYSDESDLIGERYELGEDELEAIEQEEGVTAEVSDLSRPENRFERRYGDLVEVYTSIETPGGERLLFETYQRSSSIEASEGDLLATFAPVLVVALLAFAAIEIPLAWVLARRVRGAQLDRERFLQRAIDASDRERRRIAGDLHDGPVQDLAGLAMRLSAAAERSSGPESTALDEAAAATRASIRTLRSAVVGVYPPNLQQAGLGPALSDLTARLQQEGLEVSLELSEAGFGPEVDALLYRACQEALRNVEAHAHASRVRVAVRREDARAVLEVTDDGRGVGPAEVARARGEGHMGLQILEELVRDAGGTLRVAPADGGGTVVRVEAPA